MVKGNIEDVANALALARDLIDAGGNEGTSLYKADLVLREFDEYLAEDNVSEISEEFVARKTTQFVHINKGNLKNSYLKGRFKSDFRPKSFYGTCERLIDGESRVGGCLGLSSLGMFLMMSKGLDVKTVEYDEHVGLEVNVLGKSIPLEMTLPFGFGVLPTDRRVGEVNLVSLVLDQHGNFHNKNGDKNLAMEYYNKSISLDGGCSSAYFNRGNLQEKAGNLGKSLEDFEKYASFSKENASQVSNILSGLRSRLKLELPSLSFRMWGLEA